MCSGDRAGVTNTKAPCAVDHGTAPPECGMVLAHPGVSSAGVWLMSPNFILSEPGRGPTDWLAARSPGRAAYARTLRVEADACDARRSRAA